MSPAHNVVEISKASGNQSKLHCRTDSNAFTDKHFVKEFSPKELLLERSNRERKPSVRPHGMAMIPIFNPGNYKNAIECAEREEWKCAMKEELHSTKVNNTWT